MKVDPRGGPSRFYAVKFNCNDKLSATTGGAVVTYTYGDSQWGDLLTDYDGSSITYDGVGNPNSYLGWTMSWQVGRQLAAMSQGNTTLTIAYNDGGLRTEKTVGTATPQYVWNGSQLMADVGNGSSFFFHYDAGAVFLIPCLHR